MIVNISCVTSGNFIAMMLRKGERAEFLSCTEGYQTKVYFVYGKEWYLYLCNRIAEYPLNIFQALKDIVDAPMAAA